MLLHIQRSTVSRLACPDSPTLSTCCRVFRKELLYPLSSGVPENARGVLGCLTNVIRVYPAFTLYTLHKKNRILLAHMRFFYYLCGAIYSIVLFTKRTTITILPATMEHKSCPRCGAAFICQHENPAKCQCAGVELSPAVRAHLAAQYPNQCLCRKCLLEFSV